MSMSTNGTAMSERSTSTTTAASSVSLESCPSSASARSAPLQPAARIDEPRPSRDARRRAATLGAPALAQPIELPATPPPVPALSSRQAKLFDQSYAPIARSPERGSSLRTVKSFRHVQAPVVDAPPIPSPPPGFAARASPTTSPSRDRIRPKALNLTPPRLDSRNRAASTPSAGTASTPFSSGSSFTNSPASSYQRLSSGCDLDTASFEGEGQSVSLIIDQEGFREIEARLNYAGWDAAQEMVEFRPAARMACPFTHQGLLGSAPMLRRLLVPGAGEADFLGRHVALPLKTNGPYTVEGREDKRHAWSFTYEVEDRLSLLGKIQSGEKVRAWSCALD